MVTSKVLVSGCHLILVEYGVTGRNGEYAINFSFAEIQLEYRIQEF